jgi:hypothetical protein
LSDAGVPLTAWLLVPREEGYFCTLDNAAQVERRYFRFLEWSHAHRLRFTAVGLDIEPDLRELERWTLHPWRVLYDAAKKARPDRLQAAIAQYRALVERMRADGFRVESYQFPAVVDERALGSTLLQRWIGLMDIPVDREVLILYSSLLLPRGPGMLCSYGPQASAIALGSTGGGLDPLPKLDWGSLQRDLLLARQWTSQLYLFSLEGCVEQGFLERLVGFDWSQAVPFPAREAQRAGRVRRVVRGALQTFAWLEKP